MPPGPEEATLLEPDKLPILYLDLDRDRNLDDEEPLTFSRKSDESEETDKAPLHVVSIAKEVLKLQRTSLSEDIKVERSIKVEHDVIIANPTKLHQVLMNLCTNAGHAMPDGGTCS